MKVTVRIYHGQTVTDEFQIDADPSETISDFKVKIHQSQGYDIDNQRILFCGRPQVNDKTLEECWISEKGFVVLLNARPRPIFPDPIPVEMSEFDSPDAQDQSASSYTAPSGVSSDSEPASASVPMDESTNT